MTITVQKIAWKNHHTQTMNLGLKHNSHNYKIRNLQGCHNETVTILLYQYYVHKAFWLRTYAVRTLSKNDKISWGTS